MIEAFDPTMFRSSPPNPAHFSLDFPGGPDYLGLSAGPGPVDPGDLVTEEARQALPRARSTSGGRSISLLPHRPPRLARALCAALIGALGALLAPSAALAIDEFPVPTQLSQPAGITVGPDGNLWFTEENGQKIARITTAGPITEFPFPTSDARGPSEIVTGPDGALWFTEFAANPYRIGRITTAGSITEFPPSGLPSGSAPDGITVGPDGNLWFTENGTNSIGKITTGGSITHYDISPGFRPGDIASGPDGRLWFTESEANEIGAITTDGTITHYPTGTDPSGITASGGALWFSESGANQIGQISISGSINHYPIPTPASQPSGITLGPDGALWFTEQAANKIGRMTTGGSFTEFPVPTPSSEPSEIVAGPDGAMWFTELIGNKVGRIPVGAAGGGTPPPPPPTTQQVTASVQSLSLAPSKFRAAPKGASISAKVGAKVTYRLPVAATTRFTVERETVGRKKGKKCVAKTRRNRRAKKCKRYVAVRGSFTHAGKSGSNSFRFTGRISKKKLRPGRYQLVASVPASSAKPKRAKFKIVRR
jgi:streptogramin lyase